MFRNSLRGLGHVPPVAVEELLVEDGAVGAEEVHRVESVRANWVLETYSFTQRGDLCHSYLNLCMVHMEKNIAAIYYLEADAVLLALCGRVRVVTTKHQTVAGEPAVLKRKAMSV